MSGISSPKSEIPQAEEQATSPPPALQQLSPAKSSKEWVQFDEEKNTIENGTAANTPAVLPTESIHLNVQNAEKNATKATKTTESNTGGPDPKPLRNVELPVAMVEPIRQGFSNGDTIVTLLPVNTRFPWITPAQFRPELVPEELMAQGLTLTVEEYVQAMELLVNDVRFTMYNICYKRVLFVWVVVAFSVLFALLFSGLTGLTLFGLGIGWLILNAGAIVLSIWLKYKLSKNLEKCLANVNKQLLRHKIVMALDDRGRISCHKVTLCFLFMDSASCIERLQSSIEQQERGASAGWEQRMDISASDIVIQGSRTTRLSRKQGRAEQLYLRYIQRWGKDFLRRRLDWTLDEMLGNPSNPLHISSSLCPCQYIEDILANKPPKTHLRDCCPSLSRFFAERGID